MLKAHNEKMNEFKESVTNFIDGLKEDMEIFRQKKYQCQRRQTFSAVEVFLQRNFVCPRVCVQN